MLRRDHKCDKKKPGEFLNDKISYGNWKKLFWPLTNLEKEQLYFLKIKHKTKKWGMESSEKMNMLNYPINHDIKISSIQ
ncbi:hypothetical protein [Pedobacter rhizosphaerae]|uniref:Uncharacterized protein n=1 Tax=Pedobacter rhizosphaerae TaxID=390241 RepID=A0A1H9TLM8_9SPHI|nr:hypothetical protein [Pedobacter rhizosphaerae]SER97937.1 hypothetical protein SAMN04488023_12355 [Pedobacter rhizosphaerae]